MLKYFSFLFLILFELKLFALPWEKHIFQKITNEVKECAYTILPGMDMPVPPFISNDCTGTDNSFEESFYVVNKNNSYIFLNKPVTVTKLLKNTGADYSKPEDQFLGVFLKLQSGSRYAQICFSSPLAGKEPCNLNIYVDLVDGRTTIPEVGNGVNPLPLDSSRGIYAKTNQGNDMKDNSITIQKMFSNNKKEIKISTPEFTSIEGSFLSENKLKIIGYPYKGDKRGKKQTKIFTFDPKQLED